MNDNIAYAPPQAYRKAVQRIYHGSFVELPVVPGGDSPRAHVESKKKMRPPRPLTS